MAEPWVASLANCLQSGRVEDVVYRHFPVLITILAGKDSPEVDSLIAFLRPQGVDYNEAQHLALELCETALFEPDTYPHKVLGFPSANVSKTEISKRYRLLVGIFHPDKHPQDSRWATERTERLNNANDSLRKRAKQPGSAAASSASAKPSPSANNASPAPVYRPAMRDVPPPIISRRKLGSSSHFSKRLFVFASFVVVAVLAVIFVSSLDTPNKAAMANYGQAKTNADESSETGEKIRLVSGDENSLGSNEKRNKGQYKDSASDSGANPGSVISGANEEVTVDSGKGVIVLPSGTIVDVSAYAETDPVTSEDDDVVDFEEITIVKLDDDFDLTMPSFSAGLPAVSYPDEELDEFAQTPVIDTNNLLQDKQTQDRQISNQNSEAEKVVEADRPAAAGSSKIKTKSAVAEPVKRASVSKKKEPKKSKTTSKQKTVSFSRSDATKFVGDYYRALRDARFDYAKSVLASSVQIGASPTPRDEYLKTLFGKWGTQKNDIQGVSIDPLMVHSENQLTLEARVRGFKLDAFDRKTIFELTSSISLVQAPDSGSDLAYEIVAISETEKRYEAINEGELINRFVVDYMSAYQSGNLEQFIELFDSSVKYNKKVGIDNVKSIYAKFFEATRSRKLQLKVSEQRKLSLGEIQLNIAYRLSAKQGAFKRVSNKGDMRVVLLQTPDGLRITEMVF